MGGAAAPYAKHLLRGNPAYRQLNRAAELKLGGPVEGCGTELLPLIRPKEEVFSG